MNEESQLLQHWFTPTISNIYILRHVGVYTCIALTACYTQTSPNQLLHMDLTRESFSSDLFLVLCPFSLLLFTHFLLSTSLPVLYNPCCWFLTYDSQSSPRQLWNAYPHPGQEKNQVPFFVFSLIHPYSSALLFLCALLLRRVLLFANPWTVANQAPLSMEFFSGKNGLSFPPPGDLLNPGIKPVSPALMPCIGRQILHHCATWEALSYSYQSQYPTPIFFPNFFNP